MPTYGFRCASCGEFDLVRPMSAAADPAGCPDCGADAARVYGAPALRAQDPALRRALDASARSTDRPDVVTSVPGRRGLRTSTDPRHARLPRP